MRSTGQSLRHLEINLVHGNIANLPSPAYALGLFEKVKPRGAAAEIDALTSGQVDAFYQSRLLGGTEGDVSILPMPRQRLLTDMIIFIGLGDIGRYDLRVLESVATKLANVATMSKLPSVATVPIGLSSGVSAEQFVRHFVSGFLPV